MINIFSSDMMTKIIFCLVAIQSVQSVPFEHILDKDETSDIDISGHKLFSGPCYEQYHFSYLTLWKYVAQFQTTFSNFKWSVKPKKVCLRIFSSRFLSDIGEVWCFACIGWSIKEKTGKILIKRLLTGSLLKALQAVQKLMF